MLLSGKMMPTMLTVLDFPGSGMVVFSHDCMAKNNPGMAKSAMAAGALRVSGNSNPARVRASCNNLGVMARCLLGARSALEKALKRARVAGSSLDEPEMCKGLGWRQQQAASWRRTL